MKRIMISAAAFVMAAAASFAQVNVSAGYSGASMCPSEGDHLWYNGFHAGVGYNLPLGLGFEFSPSVEYRYLNRRAEEAVGTDNAGAATTSVFNEHYLDIPLLFNYGYEITPNARIFVFAGPTVGFGLYADRTTKVEASLGESSMSGDKHSVALWGSDGDCRRFDVRIGGGVGMDICRHWRVQVGYDYGLINRTKADGLTLHPHNLKAGLTYMFK